jgi:hypothetical protein
MGDSIYYNILPKTAAAASIVEWLDAYDAHTKAARDLLDEVVGKDTYYMRVSGGSNSRQVVGIEAKTGGNHALLARLPEWRKDRQETLIPRVRSKVHPRWIALPKPLSPNWLKERLTGNASWDAWMVGMTLHGLGFKYDRETGSGMVHTDYVITKRPTFIPAPGMVRAPDQDAARDLYHAKDEEES